MASFVTGDIIPRKVYAQDLRRLFHLAYPQEQQGNTEANELGHTVLTYQFVSGLRQEIKSGGVI